ncbi:MAG TPA: outer membrane beta-barrel protein [Bryobacteraceae bacterium]|nr:outer membrane beta-barrel protein [Bryobacteraceae bacterium]
MAEGGGEQSSRRKLLSVRIAVQAAVVAVIFAAGVRAQESEEDVGEVSMSTGLAFGGSGTNFAISGAIGTSLNRYWVLMVDASYIPMGSSTLVRYPGIVVNSSGLYNFTIPIQVRVPLKRKWQPYAIIAPALIYNHYRKLGIHPNGSRYYFGASDVRGGGEIGGGVRYYWREYWGFKGEYRYTITSRNFSLLTAGIFREF